MLSNNNNKIVPGLFLQFNDVLMKSYKYRVKLLHRIRLRTLTAFEHHPGKDNTTIVIIMM